MNPWTRRIERWLPKLAGAMRRRRAAREEARRPLEHTRWGFVLAGIAPDVSDPAEGEYVRTIEGLIAESDVFVDIGANVGFYTCLARTRGKPTIAIEPFPLNVESLERNLRANNLTGVEIHRCALAERAGTGTLYGRNTLASRIPGWAIRDDPWVETISLSTLDTLLDARFAHERLAIKIDVEGGELDVLRGAARTLARRPAPVWVVEILFDDRHPDGLNPHFAQTFALFSDAGYTAWTIVPGGLRPVTADDVRGWTAERRRAFGTDNYIFRFPTP